MKPVQKILLAGLLVVGLGVGYLALQNRQPPVLPADADHAKFDDAAGCLRCHGPQGESPQSRNHPLGDDCMRCHGWP